MQKPHSDSMISEPLRLSKSGFGKKIGITPGRVSQLIKQGLPVDADGKIDVARGRIWVAENVNPVRSAAQKQDALPFTEESQQTSLTKERIRLAKEQADAVEFKNALLRDELVKATTVEREWGVVLRKVRAGVLAVPSRIRQQLPHLNGHDMQIIDRELRAALEDLSNDI